MDFLLLYYVLFPLECDKTVNIKCYDDECHDEEPRFHPVLYLQALAGVGSGNEVVPAPTDLGGAEEGDNDGAERKQVRGNDEVPEIEERAAFCERLKFDDAVAECGGKTECENNYRTNDTAFDSA